MADLMVGGFGAAVGSMIPGVGWMMGLSIGTTFGGILFPPDMGTVENGRLTDAKILTSTSGAGIPKVFGTHQVGGNAIWTSSIRETVNQDSHGGSSGGGPSYTTKDYHYDVDMLVLLCEGPVDSIDKIWFNQDVVHDTEGGTDEWADEVDNTRVAKLLGGPSQLPWAPYEAAVGVGNVPAYRGVACLGFEKLNLDKYGGMLPNVRSLVTDGVCNPQVISEYVCDKCGLDPTEYDFSAVASIAMKGFQIPAPADGRSIIDAPLAQLFLYDIVESNGLIKAVPRGGFTAPKGLYIPAYSAGATHSVRINDNASLKVSGGTSWWVSGWVKPDVHTAASRDLVWKFTSGTTGEYVVSLNAANKLVVSLNDGGVVQDLTSQYTVTTTDDIFFYYEYDSATKRGSLFINGKYDSSRTYTTGASVSTSQFGIGTRPTSTASFQGTIDEVMFGKTLLTFKEQRKLYDNGYGLPYAELPATMQAKVISAWKLDEKLGTRNDAKTTNHLTPYVYNTIDASGAVTWAAPLAGWPHRLDDAYLGAAMGLIPTGETVQVERLQEVELPKQGSLNYASEAQDYQSWTAHFALDSGYSEGEVNLSTQAVLGDNEARRLLAKVILAQWASRNGYSASALLRYLRYEPSDIVTVNTPGGLKTGRLLDMNLLPFTIVELKLADEDAEVFTQTLSSYSGNSGGGVSNSGEPLYAMMDLNALRDEDADDIGLYGVMTSDKVSWPGGIIETETKLQLASGDYTDRPFPNFTAPCVMGRTLTTLAEGPLGVWDRTNTVDVELIRGTLETADSDLDVLNGDNLAVIGYEVIKFRTATPLGNGQYRLSNLIRGYRGTEYAMTSHSNDEPFVLVNDHCRRTDLKIVEKGKTVGYRGIESGRYYGTLPTFLDVTIPGRSRKPYSPCHVKGTRAGGGDLTITWVRRVRKDGGLVDGYDAPLDEPAEKYHVDIFTDATYGVLKRQLLNLTSPTATYTSAQQVTDFGSNQATVYAIVYQYSDTGLIGFGRKAAL